MKNLKTFEDYHSSKIEEGFFTSGWKKTKDALESTEGWEAKKPILVKAISNANTKVKGAWLNRANAVNDEKSMLSLISEIDARPGNDIEDKLAGVTKGTSPVHN